MFNRVQWFDQLLGKLISRIMEKAQNKILRPVCKKHYSILVQSFPKVVIRPPKKYSWKNLNGYKKGEFYAEHKTI